MRLYVHFRFYCPDVSFFLYNSSHSYAHMAWVSTREEGRSVLLVVKITVAALSKECYCSVFSLFFVDISPIKNTSIVSGYICVVFRAL